ncbi:bifunctional adenosylcobinamide kinase/adenosylcobinamide-phosphate guanylyltransferase [Hydrogenimonas thermophila]|uniref:bifunctional adenosylcobinamide kinase/adenosylcobinamide-phosphate guanylyltransferase n=1 Tax=Hydrogenimonas thermophila TaxID=223786 RepID=UPI002936D5E2|nr:bifunctional adenosylcobinamide kinase/adenosylcobinamide-phosphate guanylyltransferase [Hydrogenimonas thermophila]WOE68951.1 bifunctional adenosylcobinamide kinase/adenosylcobinamide-phosphate guanylyltransferase [Hydrogenimonas thermophila]WOE71458.1 bifunctional adenosylcobinamide kinase/adenosylcobinamide-phosphate guanylyltransferase [Hydrogenimonas thermophila]
MIKVLYFGGQKSGKSQLAQDRALAISNEKKPYYIATYDNSFGDLQMQKRIDNHQDSRGDSFITIEESRHLNSVISSGHTYLIDCMSMWILNTISWSQDEVLQELETVAKCDANIVFVLNEVGSGVIPIDKVSREFVDRTGIVGQKLTSICDEVYEVKFGLGVRLK